jgi:AraC-like DNA-binding protein
MIRSYINEKIDAAFYLTDYGKIAELLVREGSFLKFIWVTEGALGLKLDGTAITVNAGEIICCTYLHKINILHHSGSAYLLMFNREFYCIHTNDEEVSCNGLLFFGSDFSPVLRLEELEIIRLNTLLEVLKEEFETIDKNQEEMLRILLKRFIIRCIRLARVQLSKNSLSTTQIDIIRKFNALVEEHFREQKQVSYYADLLHKSPKTLANTFNRFSDKTALNVILDRVLLEAKRLLMYTGKSVKEISGELGFEDPAHFSRFYH